MIEKFVRINSRITASQHKFAKDEAKKRKVDEAVVHRELFELGIKNYKRTK